MRSAILLGRDYRQIGALDLVAEGACALGLSRGGAAKTYRHTDPNEDACLFATGAGGTLLAVADGHGGEVGSALCLEWLLESRAQTWTSGDSKDRDALLEDFQRVLVEINNKIAGVADSFGLPPAPTTLSLALVCPGDGYLAHASVGDSHSFCARPGDLCDLGWAADRREAADYLGDLHPTGDDMRHEIGWEPLADIEAVVLMTDGFSEPGIGLKQPISTLASILQETTQVASERCAIDTCRTACQAALAIQRKNRAGDNVAAAVWIAPREV